MMILTVLQQKIHMCIPSACNSMHDPSVMIVLIHTEWQEVAALEDRRLPIWSQKLALENGIAVAWGYLRPFDQVLRDGNLAASRIRTCLHHVVYSCLRHLRTLTCLSSHSGQQTCFHVRRRACAWYVIGRTIDVCTPTGHGGRSRYVGALRYTYYHVARVLSMRRGSANYGAPFLPFRARVDTQPRVCP